VEIHDAETAQGLEVGRRLDAAGAVGEDDAHPGMIPEAAT
jgi:hypothetical protein